MKKILIILLTLLISTPSFTQSLSFKLIPKNKSYSIHDNINILIHYQNLKDSVKVFISAEVFENNQWREFDNDIFSEEDKVFDYKYLKDSGTISLKASIDSIVYNLKIKRKRRLRLVLTYQPYKYNSVLYYYKTIYSNAFVVK